MQVTPPMPREDDYPPNVRKNVNKCWCLHIIHASKVYAKRALFPQLPQSINVPPLRLSSELTDKMKTLRKLPEKSAASGNSIDSKQLLSLCQRIRQSLDALEKCIRLAQLRLTTLGYVLRSDVDGGRAELKSLKCFDNLVELCNLAQNLVGLLEELNVRVNESRENPIDYQIASQQLNYFASEYYEHLAPRLNETHEWASRLNVGQSMAGLAGRAPRSGYNLVQTVANSPNVELGDALARLRQSMRENERLIGVIASNVDHTKLTVEAIYDSLQSAKLGLEAGEQNAVQATDELRRLHQSKLVCLIVMTAAMGAAAFFLIKFLFA